MKILKNLTAPVPAWRALLGVTFAACYAATSMAMYAKCALEAQRLQLTSIYRR